MPLKREVMTWDDDFNRAQTFSTTPGMNGWTIKDTSAAGTPTYLTVSSPTGEAVLTLAATSEAEVVTLYQNDVLSYDVDQLQHVEFTLKVSGIDAVTTLVAGMASAQADTADNVAAHAWFRMEGSASATAVVVETDDGATDTDDKATGQTLSSAYKRLHIDFTHGTDDVRFYMEDTNGALRRVAEAQTFSMAGYTGNLQPFVQLQKASGTGTPSVTIDKVFIQYKRAS